MGGEGGGTQLAGRRRLTRTVYAVDNSQALCFFLRGFANKCIPPCAPPAIDLNTKVLPERRDPGSRSTVVFRPTPLICAWARTPASLSIRVRPRIRPTIHGERGCLPNSPRIPALSNTDVHHRTCTPQNLNAFAPSVGKCQTKSMSGNDWDLPGPLCGHKKMSNRCRADC